MESFPTSPKSVRAFVESNPPAIVLIAGYLLLLGVAEFLSGFIDGKFMIDLATLVHLGTAWGLLRHKPKSRTWALGQLWVTVVFGIIGCGLLIAPDLLRPDIAMSGHMEFFGIRITWPAQFFLFGLKLSGTTDFFGWHPTEEAMQWIAHGFFLGIIGLGVGSISVLRRGEIRRLFAPDFEPHASGTQPRREARLTGDL
jgi:hypothetical protein